MRNVPDGFEHALYQAPLRPRLLLWAPRNFTLFIFMMVGIALMWHLWPLIPFGVILQVFAIWGTKQDPQWFTNIWRAWWYKHYYGA